MIEYEDPSILELDHSIVLTRNLEANTRFIVNEGGTRSTKTYSLAQKAIYLCMNERGISVDITSRTFPHLRATAMRDLLNLLKEYGLYSEKYHDKTNHVYTLEGSEINFFSVDNEFKVRGRSRDYLWMTEANWFGEEDFKQLNQRTRKEIWFDYNPSDEYHWIYDRVLPSPKCTRIKSTYLDNPFLEQSIVDEIEEYKTTDPNYWRIYGLGERGVSGTTIFTHFKLIKEEDLPGSFDDECYGLDFGYNHPTALSHIRWLDGVAYVRQVIHESGLTGADIIETMRLRGVNRKVMIYADGARADLIEEIERAGFRITPADKAVEDGILKVKGTEIYMEEEAVDFWREVRAYKYMVDRKGRVLDTPIKLNDDGMDSIRYAIFTHAKAPKKIKAPKSTLIR